MKQILPAIMRGPLSATLDELTAWVAYEGYSRTTTPQILGVARAFSAWMDDHDVSITDLSTNTMDAFSAHYAPGTPGHTIVSQRLPALRRFLTETGVLPIPDQHGKRPRPPDGKHTAQPSTQVSHELEEWADWQRRTRSISSGCIRYRRMWVAELVTELSTTTSGIDWSSCSPAMLNAFVARRSNGYAPASRTAIVDSVRSLLRWALATGRIDQDLAPAVLQARTTRTTLPRGLTAAEVLSLLDSCDQNTTTGSRDAAVIRILWRLGIRAGECARLHLDDISWQAGTLTVLGKGQRRLVLPIPHDVGDCLVSWLRVRPTAATDRAVFVRMRTPIQALTSSGISDIVNHRGETAGLGRVHAHRLRHTAAMNVIAKGGSLTEAQELLGHQNSAVTSVYARVDLDSLRALATPFGTVPQ
jgi:site-specific recombinase XerD